VQPHASTVTVIDLDVVRLERVIRKVGEALVGGAEQMHTDRTMPCGAAAEQRESSAGRAPVSDR
jgi:hypothetical protein